MGRHDGWVKRVALRPTWTAGMLVLVMGCGSAGPYGYSRHYTPLGAEEDQLETVTEVTYEMLRRRPQDYTSNTVAWFGHVKDVRRDDAGHAVITLAFRTLAPRNLCDDATDSSCRVTVSARDGGRFQAQLNLRPEEQEGPDRLWIGSLVRVFGTPTGDVSEEDGPVIRASYHRHWPHGTYVTTGARRSMRR